MLCYSGIELQMLQHVAGRQYAAVILDHSFFAASAFNTEEGGLKMIMLWVLGALALKSLNDIALNNFF
jgi:hypothetical protein